MVGDETRWGERIQASSVVIVDGWLIIMVKEGREAGRQGVKE